MLLPLAGCADDVGKPSDNGATESGTCDASSSDHQCLEVTSDHDSVQAEAAFCLNSNNLWSSTEPCPTGPDLVGCCIYTAGGRGRYTECFYTGAVEPQDYCSTTAHGEWRPGSR